MQTVSFAGLTEPFVQTYRYDSLYRITEARETNGPATNASRLHALTSTSRGATAEFSRAA